MLIFNDVGNIKTGNFAKNILKMDIALIGYGRMGHEIESIAIQRGHKVTLIIDQDNTGDLTINNLRGVDVAIEFTTPDSAFRNIITCLEAKTPVVSGTTGWLQNYEKAVECCNSNSTSFIHATNFSLGVNLFFRLNIELARLMDKYHSYSVTIDETHHIKKLDAPSGTAISLAEKIAENHSLYKRWCPGNDKSADCIPVHSIREGIVPGIHTVTWDSEIDSITLTHDAKNRKGLALGAVVAAEFIHLKKGVFTMNDVMGF